MSFEAPSPRLVGLGPSLSLMIISKHKPNRLFFQRLSRDHRGIHFSRPAVFENSRVLLERGSRCCDVVNKQNDFSFQGASGKIPGQSENISYVFETAFVCFDFHLRPGIFCPFQRLDHGNFQRWCQSSGEFPRQKGTLVETPPSQASSVQRHRNQNIRQGHLASAQSFQKKNRKSRGIFRDESVFEIMDQLLYQNILIACGGYYRIQRGVFSRQTSSASGAMRRRLLFAQKANLVFFQGNRLKAPIANQLAFFSACGAKKGEKYVERGFFGDFQEFSQSFSFCSYPLPIIRARAPRRNAGFGSATAGLSLPLFRKCDKINPLESKIACIERLKTKKHKMQAKSIYCHVVF